jgi:hypothetical protein
MVFSSIEETLSGHTFHEVGLQVHEADLAVITHILATRLCNFETVKTEFIWHASFFRLSIATKPPRRRPQTSSQMACTPRYIRSHKINV